MVNGWPDAVARNVVQRLKKYPPTEFGVAFDNRVYFAMLDNCLIAVEEYVEGEFQKCVNNTGECMVPPNDDLGILSEKAETLVHCSYFMSARKFMFVNLQRAAIIIWPRNYTFRTAKCCWSKGLFLCWEVIKSSFWKFREKSQIWGVFPFNGASRICMKVS